MRYGITIPFDGVSLHEHREWFSRVADLGYTDVWSSEVDGAIDHRAARLSATEIVEFERSLVNDGTTVVKFWLHISDAEQLARFESRASDPLKQWKLTPDDWRNRERRADYLDALSDMVDWTDHPRAHWDLIAAENKHYARVAVLETLIERWTHDLSVRGVPVPPAHGGDYLH